MDFYNWPNKVEGDLNALDFYIVILECTFNVVCHVVYYYTTEFCLKRALCSSSQKMIMILWRGKKIKLEWNNWRLLLNRVFTSLYAVHEALFCTQFYIQLLYLPHLGPWILLFGLLGSKMKTSETTEFLLKSATFWGVFFMFSWSKN